jgi:dTDP-4-amino-4,6-dideoxygalactose transaminase
MESLWKLARQHGLFVIEDAAHATGAHYRGYPIGGSTPRNGWHSDAVAFSFYATKNLSVGEGGMVTCSDEELLESMRILCLHGISKDAWSRYTERGRWHYEVVECGFKYNLSDIQSAIGIEQLRKQENFLEMRKQIVRFYNEQFASIEELELPYDSREHRHAWHLYSLRLNLKRLRIHRAEFIEKLRERGVGTSVHFIPIPEHPYYVRFPELAPCHCPRAMELYPRLVSLPLYPDLSMREQAAIAESVKSIVHRHKRKTTYATRAAVVA